jgi:hypothetical protein
MKTAPIITLLTDFGLTDTYAGQVKGVILSIAPEARIVDLTHEIPPQNVLVGAFLLASSTAAFPRGTIHAAVVDPGVGTSRKIICALCRGHVFLAPDNGILSLVFAAREPEAVYQVKNPAYFRGTVAPTFQGRDIIAPAAAHLALGLSPSKLGPRLRSIKRIEIPIPRRVMDKTLRGEVIHIDRFGNAVTNIAAAQLKKLREPVVFANNIRVGTVSTTFSDGPHGGAVAVIGSFNALEIAVNGGSAAKTLGLETGDPVTLHWK